MKAIEYRRYGAPDVLELVERPRPVPAEGEVLIRVHASSVTSGDWRLRASAFPGVFWLPARLGFGLCAPKQRVLGSEVAGEVVQVGSGVTRFRVGDRVFGYSGFGAYAEFLTMPETGVLDLIPDGLDDESAAAVPNGALCALSFLRDFAKVQPGDRVLINGAAGGVGSYAVQLAKHLGAHVTGVCRGVHAPLVTRLGADVVIDYEREDFTARGDVYDVILDTAGTTRHAACRGSLADDGRHVYLHFGPRELLQAVTTSLTRGPTVRCGVATQTREDLELVTGLLRRGKLTPVLDRTFALADIGAAHAYAERGRKTGSVVVVVTSEEGRGADLAEPSPARPRPAQLPRGTVVHARS